MIEQGYCTKEYEDAVFENTEKFGPYYVLCENLALIHASNQSGVNETQMAVTVLKEPVKFKPDGYDVRILHLLQKIIILTWKVSKPFPISSQMNQK